MSSAVKKAMHVYRNQGLSGVIRKIPSTTKYRARLITRRLPFHREKIDENSYAKNIILYPMIYLK
jgi:hypothetical protein